MRNWDEVYANQKVILQTLQGIDEIFLAGGTAVQCYLLPKKYRESEDLDFFVAYEMSSKESSKLARIIIKTLSQNKQLQDIRHKQTEDGTHRIFCGVEGASELVKIELLNFTTDRFGELDFVVHKDFPRIENPYNLLLYKLKALCDRTDTIKDLFDIYFLFKILKPINLKQMLLDLEFKFLEATGYVYNTETLINALNSTRRWDIVLTEDSTMHYAMKEAIITFQNDFANMLLLAPKELDFSYEAYLETKMRENKCETVEEYLSFFEENIFVEEEIRRQ
ncbi:MAG: nucleotidyl transferase AbiEii/AbiGii toxin family protein [Epsilonproteobacteria bacterium]|nr:nucleotidyl transferase AbiEii/AbiGii toxin family protein [Campylobacterota bacterium]